MELHSVGEQLMEQILKLREAITILEAQIDLDRKSLNCQNCTEDFYREHMSVIEANEMYIKTKLETIRSLENNYSKLNIEHKLDENVDIYTDNAINKRGKLWT